MFDQMRSLNAGANSPLKNVIQRSIDEKTGFTVAGLRAPGFRSMAPFYDRAQVYFDKAVTSVGMQRLSFVKALIQMGLTVDLPNPLSHTQYEWYSRNKIGNAQRTMSPSARTENAMPILLPNRLPVYLTTSGFEIDIRTLEQSRRIGLPIDTAQIEAGTRAVNEAIEDAALNGATTIDGQQFSVAGYSAPGLLNAPNALTQALSLAAWSTAPVGTTILANMLTMIGQLQGNLYFGPYTLIVPTTVGTGFQGDFSTTKGDNSIWDRVQKVGAGDVNVRVIISDMMPSNKVALVQMTKDVVAVLNGQSPTTIPWTSLDGFTVHNLIMAIMVPLVRYDYNGKSGIVIGTLT